jgi:polysaccharide export outer membrane protein
VRAIPDWNPSAIVTVSGEVRFPGQYRLERGERLADLVRRAGGFSENAFPEGAVLTRTSVAENERKRAQELASTIRQSVAASLLTEEVQSISLAEISELTKELATFEGQGRLLIDVPAAMGGNDLANIRLLNGDKLEIPQNLSNVTVVGEVKRQGTHSFQAGYDIQDYLGLSAGLTARADAAGLYVVRANGSVEIVEQSLLRFTKRNIDLRPGDTIVVPVNSRYKESLVAWREITQIIYQGAVSIAAVVAL